MSPRKVYGQGAGVELAWAGEALAEVEGMGGGVSKGGWGWVVGCVGGG